MVLCSCTIRAPSLGERISTLGSFAPKPAARNTNTEVVKKPPDRIRRVRSSISRATTRKNTNNMNGAGCKRGGSRLPSRRAKVYNFFVILKRILPLVFVVLLCWSGTVLAQYTLVLKNGGRITVQTYREEGGMIKFQGLGGEIGLAKDPIKAILKPGEKEERGMVVPGLEGVRAAPAEAKPEGKEAAAPH